jgi:uncharacterized protein (DUF488 family)
VGHGTANQPELLSRIQGADVRSVVDIRIAPGSRRHPHVSRAELGKWLPEAGISYRWEKRLGGFRAEPSTSPDSALENASFRGYAAWMRGPEFGRAVDELLADAATVCTTVMCSETVWWRCHRRLVADYVVVIRGWVVLHVMPGGRVAEHRLTQGLRRADSALVYDSS